MNSASKTMSSHGVNTLNTAAGSTFSPLIQLIDDDEAVRDALSLLIGTIGLRVQPWADPQAFMQSFDRQAIGAIVLKALQNAVRQHVKSRERNKTDWQVQERFAQPSER